jgi:hypothetical protein
MIPLQNRTAAESAVRQEGNARSKLRKRAARCLGIHSFSLGLTGLALHALAQDNYEIQVYGSDLVAPGSTMVELHSNFTGDGRQQIEDGVLPTNHAFHETLEITQGFTPWFETGFYVFSSARWGDSWQWVGDHIRPRVSIPEDWKWPVGLSLSLEAGYQQRTFSTDTWTLEIRPIIDKKWGRWYGSFNPTFDRSLRGENSARGYAFSPSFKISYAITEKVAFGMEYYGSAGPVTHFDPFENQEHLIMPAFDLDVSPDWEINFGIGVGITKSTDSLIVKVILGRRFHK